MPLKRQNGLDLYKVLRKYDSVASVADSLIGPRRLIGALSKLVVCGRIPGQFRANS